MKKFKPVQFINKETGEVFTSEQIITKFEVVPDNKASYQDFKISNIFMNESLGYYFHLLYGDILSLNLEPQMLIRFLKLCSYLNYENVLVTGVTRGQKKITEKDLEVILNLKKREAINTKNYLVSNNLISIDDDLIEIKTKFIKRGELNGDIKSMEVTRIFNNGIKELYDNVKPIQHKKLATFIKILPYISIKYNVICENPLEEDITLIKPLTWTELGRRIGLSEATAKRLRSELWNFKIDNSVTIGEFSTLSCGKAIVVNPSVYYKGNDMDSLKGIINLFKLQK